MLKLGKKISIALSLAYILLFLNSCSLFVEPIPNTWQWGLKPRPLTGIRNFPSADTDYGKGFRDGCQTGFNAVTKGLAGDLTTSFDYKRMKKSSDYGTGWNDGMEQCTYIMDWDVP